MIIFKIYIINSQLGSMYTINCDNNIIHLQDFDLFKNFITPIDGDVSTQCREDSIRYMDILNNVMIINFSILNKTRTNCT